MTTTTSKPNGWTCLSIEGPDSRTFLQGQLSNDLDMLNEQQGGFFALCTPKGRTLANFFIIQQPGDQAQNLLLLIPESTANIVLDTLAKYIVFSKAELKASQAWQTHFVQLDEAVAYQELNLAEPGAHSMSAMQSSTHCLLRIAENNSLGLLVAPAKDTKVAAMESSLLSDNDAELSLIRAGVGIIQAQTSDEFVPQMINMQLNNGISFTKGCYTGQEIVARSQYRGKIKRRMYRGSCQLTKQPDINAEIVDLGTGKALGTVLSSAKAADDHCEVLAVMSLKDGVEHQLAIDTTELGLLSLPYGEESAAT